MDEYVILVDNSNRKIGIANKNEIHSQNTPLHRAFSVFLFNHKNQLLLQQRGFNKRTFPLIWSNTCCGHPIGRESAIQASKRRLFEELGIICNNFYIILPKFKYKTPLFNNIVENEFCPVLIGFYIGKLKLNKNEVENTYWIYWNDFMKKVKNNDTSLSYWCKKEALLLNKNKKFNDLLRKNIEP